MDVEQSFERDEIISGPIILGLSTNGVENFMSRGQKLKKFAFFDGGELHGMELPSVTFKALQKMTMTGTVQRIERQIKHLASQRKGVISLSRCFALATVYRQFEARLWEIINKSDVLFQWNRAYPKVAISQETNLAQPTFQALLKKSAQLILERKQEVLRVVQNQISADRRSLPDEKKALTLLAIRYLNAIDPAVWMLIASARDPLAADTLIGDLQRLLVQYVGRSEFPEYLSLLLVELIVLISDIPTNEEHLDSDHKPVFLSLDLGSMRKSQEERSRVRVQLGSDTVDFASLRTKIDQQANVKNTSAQAHEDDASLGLMYLAYVRDACKRMDISFDFFVNQVPHTRRSIVNLLMTI